jgi:hypothetical protein
VCDETAADLADGDIPYFKAGLENDEACFWVTAPINLPASL